MAELRASIAPLASVRRVSGSDRRVTRRQPVAVAMVTDFRGPVG